MKLGLRNAVVVAHPDDETLWAGGFLYSHRASRWDIICCSIPRLDPVRAWKFHRACHALGASPLLMPYTESPPNEPLRWLDNLDDMLGEYDLVLTHGAAGEYGHLHHKQVHKHVMRVARDKDIDVLTFDLDGDIEVELSSDEADAKMAALKCYDHLCPYNGFAPPKWKALLHRYETVGKIPFARERFTLAERAPH